MSTIATIGHNSGSCSNDEYPRQKPPAYIRFYASDYRSGTICLSVEEEGLYIRCIAYMYDTGNPIPADEREAARILSVNLLKYRKLMTALLAKGKFMVTNRGIINRRVVAELEAYWEDKERRSKAAKKGWEAVQKIAEEVAPQMGISAQVQEHTPPVTPPVTHGVTPPVTPPVTHGVESENLNENNIIEMQTPYTRARSISQKPEREERKKDLGDGLDSVSTRSIQFEARPPEVSWPGQVAKAAAVAGMVSAAAAAGFPAWSAAASEPPPHPLAQVQTEPQPAACWQTPKARMAAGMSADERRAQFEVWKTGTGLVEVGGEFKAELERMFPLVDLACGLAAAGPNVFPDQGALRAMQAIRRQFGFMQVDAKGKADRYQATYAAKVAQKSFNGTPAHGTDERRKNLRDEYTRAGLDPDSVLQDCVAKGVWTLRAQGLWAASPDGAAAEIVRAGAHAGVWRGWKIEEATS
jgi:uncharacterized protein YdaU (DUF1376 family)